MRSVAKKTRVRTPAAEQAPRHFGELLSFKDAAAFVGICETRLGQARAFDPEFPRPVKVAGVPGANPLELYRRRDLSAWVRALRPVDHVLRTRGAAA